ncbi:Thymidylate kinase [candidate division SR1 bacterium Aalborg_AAW-1]|nr:Thymidylate kinase [candidate division SR1 bacterium Aalborg_AAW-1]
MYIVFEGTVGTGKSTQSKLLVEHLKSQYPDREVIRVREPGKTPIAEAIRTLVQGTEFPEEMDPICEAYLYSAARAQLINTITKPALEREAIVVSDRCFWSSLSYQGYTKGTGIETIWQVNKPIVESCLPDLVLFFDMPVEIGLSRTFDGVGDKHELNGKEFFEQAHEGYLKCVEDGRFAKKAVSINALGTIEEVSTRILTQVNPLLS